MATENFDLLVLDDEQEILDIIKETFAGQGLRVRTATSVSKALQLVCRYSFHVILSDQHLPDGNGVDFLASLPELGIDSVPILMTGYMELSIATEAINRGKVYKFVHKPLDLRLLQETVEQARELHDVRQRRRLFTREVVENNVRLRRETEAKEASLRDATVRIQSGRETVVRQQVEIESLYSEIQKAYLQTVTSLTKAIEAKDKYTRGHSERVYYYCCLMAEDLKLPESSKVDLRFASLLHDLGKIGIPDSILCKKGGLNDDEIRVISTHPELSENILKPLPFLDKIRRIIRHHHEWYNGTGYPDGLCGEEISIEGRILSVADAFDAMRSDRPYRRALNLGAALDQLRQGSGTQFCPKCVDSLTRELAISGEFKRDTSSWQDERWVTDFVNARQTRRVVDRVCALE
jgi:response regulator RpfG family c-di-GMP phosphodiesterase